MRARCLGPRILLARSPLRSPPRDRCATLLRIRFPAHLACADWIERTEDEAQVLALFDESKYLARDPSLRDVPLSIMRRFPSIPKAKVARITRGDAAALAEFEQLPAEIRFIWCEYDDASHTLFKSCLSGGAPIDADAMVRAAAFAEKPLDALARFARTRVAESARSGGWSAAEASDERATVRHFAAVAKRACGGGEAALWAQMRKGGAMLADVRASTIVRALRRVANRGGGGAAADVAKALLSGARPVLRGLQDALRLPADALAPPTIDAFLGGEAIKDPPKLEGIFGKKASSTSKKKGGATTTSNAKKKGRANKKSKGSRRGSTFIDDDDEVEVFNDFDWENKSTSAISPADYERRTSRRAGRRKVYAFEDGSSDEEDESKAEDAASASVAAAALAYPPGDPTTHAGRVQEKLKNEMLGFIANLEGVELPRTPGMHAERKATAGSTGGIGLAYEYQHFYDWFDAQAWPNEWGCRGRKYNLAFIRNEIESNSYAVDGGDDARAVKLNVKALWKQLELDLNDTWQNLKAYYSSACNVAGEKPVGTVCCDKCDVWRAVPPGNEEPTAEKWHCKDATWCKMKCGDCNTQFTGPYVGGGAADIKQWTETQRVATRMWNAALHMEKKCGSAYLPNESSSQLATRVTRKYLRNRGVLHSTSKSFFDWLDRETTALPSASQARKRGREEPGAEAAAAAPAQPPPVKRSRSGMLKFRWSEDQQEKTKKADAVKSFRIAQVVIRALERCFKFVRNEDQFADNILATDPRKIPGLGYKNWLKAKKSRGEDSKAVYWELIEKNIKASLTKVLNEKKGAAYGWVSGDAMGDDEEIEERVKAFVRDMNLVFSNCEGFNAANPHYVEYAQKMRGTFEARLANARREIEAARDDGWTSDAADAVKSEPDAGGAEAARRAVEAKELARQEAEAEEQRRADAATVAAAAAEDERVKVEDAAAAAAEQQRLQAQRLQEEHAKAEEAAAAAAEAAADQQRERQQREREQREREKAAAARAEPGAFVALQNTAVLLSDDESRAALADGVIDLVRASLAAQAGSANVVQAVALRSRRDDAHLERTRGSLARWRKRDTGKREVRSFDSICVALRLLQLAAAAPAVCAAASAAELPAALRSARLLCAKSGGGAPATLVEELCGRVDPDGNTSRRCGGGLLEYLAAPNAPVTPALLAWLPDAIRGASPVPPARAVLPSPTSVAAHARSAPTPTMRPLARARSHDAAPQLHPLSRAAQARTASKRLRRRSPWPVCGRRCARPTRRASSSGSPPLRMASRARAVPSTAPSDGRCFASWSAPHLALRRALRPWSCDTSTRTCCSRRRHPSSGAQHGAPSPSF